MVGIKISDSFALKTKMDYKMDINSTTTYLILPGLGNSGPDHWQSHLERKGEHFIRVHQMDWESPKCDDWLEAFDLEINKHDHGDVVLIGHSLACVAIAHWANKYGKMIKGAFLVAPSDIEKPAYAFNAIGFDPIPLKKIPFPTIVVASTNDPWVSLGRAKYFAENWGSQFVNIGDAGHINTDSGFGPWDEGFAMLERFEI